MKYVKLTAALLAMLVSVSLLQVMRADEWDKDTVFTIKEPIQLPTMVLQPGTYVMKLVDSPADRHIVQVWDKDRQHLITTTLAIPNYRLKVTGKTVFQFWETPEGQPKALRAWFYPGNMTGQEFAYPKDLSSKIAAYSKENVPTATGDQDLKTAELRSTDQSGQTRDLDKEAYTPPPAPAPVAAAPAAPEPPPIVAQNEPPKPIELVQTAQATPPPTPVTDDTAPAELPKTASPMPLVGLAGLVFMAGFGLTLRKSVL